MTRQNIYNFETKKYELVELDDVFPRKKRKNKMNHYKMEITFKYNKEIFFVLGQLLENLLEIFQILDIDVSGIVYKEN